MPATSGNVTPACAALSRNCVKEVVVEEKLGRGELGPAVLLELQPTGCHRPCARRPGAFPGKTRSRHGNRSSLWQTRSNHWHGRSRPGAGVILRVMLRARRRAGPSNAGCPRLAASSGSRGFRRWEWPTQVRCGTDSMSSSCSMRLTRSTVFCAVGAARAVGDGDKIRRLPRDLAQRRIKRRPPRRVLRRRELIGERRDVRRQFIAESHRSHSVLRGLDPQQRHFDTLTERMEHQLMALLNPHGAGVDALHDDLVVCQPLALAAGLARETLP